MQEGRLKKEIEGLEQATGIKLRVLAQNYPNTPGRLDCSRDSCVCSWPRV